MGKEICVQDGRGEMCLVMKSLLGGPASPLMQPPTTWPGTPLAVGAPDSSPIPAVPTQPTPVLPRSDLKAHVPAPSLDPCQARVSGAGQRH